MTKNILFLFLIAFSLSISQNSAFGSAGSYSVDIERMDGVNLLEGAPILVGDRGVFVLDQLANMQEDIDLAKSILNSTASDALMAAAIDDLGIEGKVRLIVTKPVNVEVAATSQESVDLVLEKAKMPMKGSHKM